jgi:flagellar hook-associated protein 2
MLNSIAANLGFGSGIDTAGLVNDLASASRGPKIQRFETLARANAAKISALAQARSDLDGFASSLSDVVGGGTLRSQPTVSDESALSASANAGVSLGTLASEIEITRLAAAQTVYSGFVSAAGDTVGQGSMTLTIGGTAHNIIIDAGNDSLTGLAGAINASGAGVQARVINDSNGARLVLKGETGAAKAFTLTPDAGADPGLNRFTYDLSGGLMTLGQAATDAQFKVDGVAFTRASNSISDALPGVTLTLKKAAPGLPVSIGSKRPTDIIRQTVTDFIGVFNTLKRDIAAARTATGGDGAMRTLDQQMGALISKAVTSDPRVNSLSDIGIGTNRDGSISVNAAQLEAALTTSPDAVEALFNPLRDATHDEATDPGISLALKAIKEGATASNGVLDGLKSRLDKEAAAIAKDREKTESREDAYRARLERQFGSMDARIGALKATQTYLEQQIKLWSNPQG